MKKSYKKVASTILLTCCVFIASAQTNKIDAQEASKHVGDSLSVCGKVFGGIYLQQSKGRPTLINVGDAYPKSPFTAVIFEQARGLFKDAPETYYKDSTVCFTGKIALYNGKPQIVISHPAQVAVQH